jgi:TolB-like protein
MVGETISHYRILEKIGAGGMGVVYRARDERLDRDVAIKVLPPGLLTDETARRRFRHEALALAKLNHPNIETLHEFDTQQGVDFLVMEYIPGTTLSEKLAAGPLPARELLRLGTQLAHGLTAAHERGVVHRDLKPGNLRVTPDGLLKILDFGLARWLHPANLTSGGASTVPTADPLTGSFVAAGTLAYMAPEQFRGQAADARSDIYGAGAVLYEMSTGHRPFPETQPSQLIDAILQRAPHPPSSLNRETSPGLENVILKALDKDPERRYQSARELAVDLERLSTPATSARVPAALRPLTTTRRRALAILGSLVAILALLVGLNVGGWRERLFLRWGTPGGIQSLAVLPLKNLSADPEQEYFADGMTEALITDLAKIGSLRVISRTSVMRYKTEQQSLPEIARRLRVDALLEGSVQRGGGRVRVTAQLIDTRTDAHIWAENFDAELKDVLTLQSDIARAVAQRIQVILTPAEQQHFVSVRHVDPEAYDLYLRGRAAFYRYTQEGLKEAIGWYEKAMARDADFAPAYAGLALAYGQYINLSVIADREWLDRAAATAQEAIRRQPTLAEGHFALGFARAMGGDWVPARQAYLETLALEPNHAHAHAGLGYVYENTGFLKWAEEESERTRALDPYLGPPYWHLNNVWHAWGEHRRAWEVLERSPVRDSELSTWQLARELYELEDQERLKALVAEIKHRGWTGHTLDVPLALSELAAGRRSQGRARLRSLTFEYVRNPRSTSLVASIFAVAGEADLSLQWLEEAVWLGYANYPLLSSGSEYAFLRGNPRFQKLLAQVQAKHEQYKKLWESPARSDGIQ